MKADQLRGLFSPKEDSRLCDDVFLAVAKAAGVDFDTSNLPQPCQTISLVWYSAGIVGANGFEHLLEGDFKGDPGYKLTLAAYHGIDAREAFQAFQEIFELFPSHELPIDRIERMRIFHSIPGDIRYEIDQRFFGYDAEIGSKLATYIRTNEASIREFLSSMP